MATQNQTPALRFKGYTFAWEQRKLGDIGRATGGTAIESEFDNNGKYKVISIGSYSENSVYTDQNLRAPLTEKTKDRILNKNDLTMILNDKTASGNIIGRVLLIDRDDSYVYNQRTERIEPCHQKYDSQFLYQMLNAPEIRSKIIKQAQGNTQIYVNWSAIKALHYLIPTRPEQQQIGHFFHTFDSAIALHKQKLNELKQLKKGYLQQMFPQAGETVPRMRFAGFNEAWKCNALGDMVEIVMGQSPDSKNYTDNPNDYILVQGNADMKNGKVIPRVWTTQITKTAQKGDLIISVRAPVGDIGKTDYDIILGRGVAAVKGNEFIFQTLSRMKSFGYWERVSSGSTFESINSSDLKDVQILFPALAEQTVIGNFFYAFDAKITAQTQKIKQLRQLKNAYLQRMFI